MPTIPSGQQFHTLGADVATTNRGSATANADRTIYTMADIASSIPSGLSGSGTADTLSMWSDASTLTDSNVTQDGNGIVIPKRISHLGDLDTYIQFPSDNKIELRCETDLCLEATNAGVSLYGNGGLTLMSDSSGIQIPAYLTNLRLATPKLHVTATTAPTNTAKGPLNIVFGTAPTSAATAGYIGDVIIEADAIYVCTATGAATAATWKKAALVAV